ncbi:MAG: hypothetical protein KDA29_06755 [Phycisphaerales bacterium]|nr:hypothetical protein [Phycisphaerales bacterium]
MFLIAAADTRTVKPCITRTVYDSVGSWMKICFSSGAMQFIATNDSAKTELMVSELMKAIWISIRFMAQHPSYNNPTNRATPPVSTLPSFLPSDLLPHPPPHPNPIFLFPDFPLLCASA